MSAQEVTVDEFAAATGIDPFLVTAFWQIRAEAEERLIGDNKPGQIIGLWGPPQVR